MTDSAALRRRAWLEVEIARGQAVIRSVEPVRARVALMQAELDALDPNARASSAACAKCSAAPDEACRLPDPGSCSRSAAGAWRAPYLAASCPIAAQGGCPRRTS